MNINPETGRVVVQKPVERGPEHSLFYFSPRLAGVRFAPEDFRDRLRSEMGDELEVTWHPIEERWLVWMRSPKVTHPRCAGWKLLFVHNGPSGEYAALDERVFARLWSCSARVYGDGKQYMDRIFAEMDREKAAYEKKAAQDAIDAAMPYYDHSQISISMRGQSNGSKFSDYLS